MYTEKDGRGVATLRTGQISVLWWAPLQSHCTHILPPQPAGHTVCPTPTEGLTHVISALFVAIAGVRS